MTFIASSLFQMCIKCQQPLNNGYNDYSDGDDHYDEVMGRLVMDLEEEDEEINLDGQGEVKVWACPVCPHVFNRHAHFKTHACTAHDISQHDIGENNFVKRHWENHSKTGFFLPDSITPVTMTEEDYLKRQAENDDEEEMKINGMINEGSNGSGKGFPSDKSRRKPIGKDFGPNAFSSTFSCYFCSEMFRKDYRLKLHLMLNHKNESPEVGRIVCTSLALFIPFFIEFISLFFIFFRKWPRPKKS